MVFIDFAKVDIPQTNSNGSILYSTTFPCMLFFVPIGSRMEDDAPVGLYVDNYFTDTDGGQADLYLYYSRAAGSAPLNLNRDNSGGGNESYTNTMVIAPSGKNIRAFIANSSDRIGGTLYVFRLPE
jgi:hypothetical protein